MISLFIYLFNRRNDIYGYWERVEHRQYLNDLLTVTVVLDLILTIAAGLYVYQRYIL